MSRVQTKLASAIFVGATATLLSSTVFVGSARAADDCLSEPNGPTPQGKHWYYRLERGTGRHCWYFRGEDEPARAAATESTPTAKAPSRNADMLAPRSIADARAEWPARPDVTATTPRIAPPAAAGSATPVTTAQAPAAGPWPDPSRAMTSPGAPPATTVADADQPTDTASVPTPAPASPQAAPMPTERNMGSLQKLLLVAFGALALAGLSGSGVYRLAGARRKARMRRDRWPTTKPQLIAADVAMQPWVPPEIDTAKLERDLMCEPGDIVDFETESFDERVVRMERRPAGRPQRSAHDAAIQQDMLSDEAIESWPAPQINETAPPLHETADDIDDVDLEELEERVILSDRRPANKSQYIAGDAPMPPRPKIGEETPQPRNLTHESVGIDDVEADGPVEQVERIEDFLARLTRQIEAEMGAPRPQQRAAN